MSKKILLIESDAPFAEELSSALEARDLEVRVTGDGREGFELAREWSPDAIVLCVELPGMSGYVICQKLKKDEALKSIPLVITSAEATPETFEKHKTLKVRAEDYLLKPYSATALLASLGAFLDINDVSAEVALPAPEEEEELVALEEEAGIEALDGEPLGGPDLPALDLGSLPDDGPAPAEGGDDALKLLDEAFEGLAEPMPPPRPSPRAPAKPPARRAPEPPPPARDELALDFGPGVPMAADELDAAAASLPEEDESGARAALGRLDLVADDAVGALGGPELPPEPDLPDLGADLGLAPLEVEREEEPPRPPPPSRPTLRGASVDSLRAAGIKLMDERPAPSAASGAGTARLERELARKDQRVADLEGRLRDAEERLGEAERRAEEAEQRADAAEGRASAAATRLSAAETQAATSRSRLETAAAQAKRLEADLKSLREEARRAAERADQADAALDDERRRADEAEARASGAGDAQEKIDGLERELDELKTELVVARGEVEGARGEVEKRTGELKKRVQELEAQSSKNEERVVKAYLKIKNDEKLREKTKKALAIALQLLDEGAPPAADADKARPSQAPAAAAALGRE